MLEMTRNLPCMSKYIPSDEALVSSPLALYSADYSDDDYVASDNEGSVTGNSDQEEELKANKKQKFVVFESCLKKHQRFCPRCGSVISKAKEKTCGSMLSVMMQCMNNHNESWISQPVPRNTAAAILFGENSSCHFVW